MNELMFTESQVLFLLRKVEAGASVMQICRKYGIGKIKRYRVPSKSARAVRGGLFSCLDHNPDSSGTQEREPQTNPAADVDLQFSYFMRIDRSSMKLCGAPHYLTLDNAPELGSVSANGRMHSLGIDLGRETSSHFSLHHMWSDYTRRYAGLLAAAPARCAPRRRYSDDFKADAISLADSIGLHGAARQLGIPTKTLRNWLHVHLLTVHRV